MKEIKAWAIVDKRGDMAWAGSKCWPEIYMTKEYADSFLGDQRISAGERVVRVTVRIEE